ncbi:MAG TPA: hypothetical protein PLA83_01670 [Deltaproteobacteria bacterium]|nr:hypothetical protein [Deltaproteobacteria bacterium]HQH99757.1 hypothetical protein [Deltaproteobacteria bacterium]HQJ09780.1 hypothetical protein [Deltaproteobacteria bacterium]
MTRHAIVAAVISVMLLAGCSTVSVQKRAYLGVPAYQPTDPAKVEILRTEPTRPFDRLGEIDLEPAGNPPVQKLEQKLKDAAAQMGADAAVIVADKTRLMGGYVTGPWWGGQIVPEYGRVIVAVAIRYRQ